MTGVGHRRIEVHVAFDTQIAYSDSTRFVADKFRSAITAQRDYLATTWWIPDVVWLERRRQMIQALQKAVSYAPRLALLTGKEFQFAEDEITAAVDRQMEKEAAELVLSRFVPSYGGADWPSIITAAVDGAAPFERTKERETTGKPREAEKGFRDRMVGEAFAQLRSQLDRDNGGPILFLVCEDRALRSFIEGAGLLGDRVRLLVDDNELRAALNALNLEQRGVFMTQFRDAAAKLFYTEGDTGTLFYAADLLGQITRDYSEALEDTPTGAVRNPKGYEVKEPVPEDMRNGEMVWSSRVSVIAELTRRSAGTTYLLDFKTYPTTTPSPSRSAFKEWLVHDLATQTSWPSRLKPLWQFKNASDTGYAPDFISTTGDRIEAAVVEDAFEVRWRARLDHDALVDTRVEGIRYTGRSGGFS